MLHVWRFLPVENIKSVNQSINALPMCGELEDCITEYVELKCAIAALELVLNETLSEFPYDLLTEVLKRKRAELAVATERLKHAYDLQLIHLRARVLDYQRDAKCCGCTPRDQKEIALRISRLKMKIEYVFNVKSDL